MATPPSRLIIREQPITVTFYREPLAEGVDLKMMEIPAGAFDMGSPDDEEGRTNTEGPVHRVQVPRFFMGQYPVTQAQWRVVADWDAVERELDPDPADFKGADRPVENVSWHDAMEFCARLAQRTGRGYRLPSEAEWEYACRAGTTTPFYFGETLTTDLANYNGRQPYGPGPTGDNRSYTTSVGQFEAPNAFGLYDVHGNVWEWCADPWHDNYEGAPTDGSVWYKGGNRDMYAVRGGSWPFKPEACRSAYRFTSSSGDRLYNFGFRVACSSKGFA